MEWDRFNEFQFYNSGGVLKAAIILIILAVQILFMYTYGHKKPSLNKNESDYDEIT